MNAIEVTRAEAVTLTVEQEGSEGRKIKGVKNMSLKFFLTQFSPRWNMRPSTSPSPLTTPGMGTRWKCSGRPMPSMLSLWMSLVRGLSLPEMDQ